MQVEAQHSIPFLPYVLDAGDVLVLHYGLLYNECSLFTSESVTVKRKYLVLSTTTTSTRKRRAFCVVLYADRYVNPGDSLWIDLDCLPLNMCLIERKR